MRVAALYDIHGMLTPLEAVLPELERERLDAVVLGGDVVGGPQPAEVLARLDEVDVPLVWIRGNGERALGPDAADATGAEAAALEFTREAVVPERAERLAALATAMPLEVDGLGDVLFCHAAPSGDDVLITAETPDEVLRRTAVGVEQRTIVCGHTHMQYDRTVGGVRWVNAGAVGMPYEGEVAAFWAVLGPDVEFRRTPFDVERAIAEIAASGWPDAGPFIEENLRQAVSREEATAHFENLARQRGER
jgi:predicted phosphodiesterase